MQRPRDDGIAVLEALVATTIFVLTAAAAYKGIGLGLRALRSATSTEIALAVATKRLAELSSAGVFDVGAGSGSERTVNWQSEVRAYEGVASGSLRGYWLRVTVTWNDAARSKPHSMTLETLQLAVNREGRP